MFFKIKINITLDLPNTAYESLLSAVFSLKICLYLNNKLNEFNNQSIGHR